MPASLSEIPENLVERILERMSLTTGVRMRQTGHFINDIVDRRNISFRSDFLFLKLLIVFSIRLPLKVLIIFKNKKRVKGHQEVSDLENADFLECVEFDQIVVWPNLFYRKVRPEYRRAREHRCIREQVLPFVRSYRLKCDLLKTHEVPFREICHIARCIRFQKFQDQSSELDLAQTTDLFNTRNCKRIGIVSNIPDRDFLLTIRQFEHVAIHMVNKNFTREFAAFVEDCRFSDTGRLRKVFVRVAPFLGISIRNTWPGTEDVWQGRVHHLQPSFAQINLIMPVFSDKLIIILTKEQNSYRDQLMYFSEPGNTEDIVLLIIKLACPLQPVDGSHVFKEINDSPQAYLPDILRTYLNQIYF